MDLIEALIKRLKCRHAYEFRSRYYRVKKQKLGLYEDYQCIKCGKRKEKKINENLS